MEKREKIEAHVLENTTRKMITMTIQFRFGRKTNSNFGESSQESKWMSILYHDYTKSNNDLIEKNLLNQGKMWTYWLGESVRRFN